MHLELDKSMEILAQSNINVTSKKQPLKDIAKDNGISPQQVYLFIRNYMKSSSPQASGDLAEEPVPSGLGRKTLAQVSTEYKVDLQTGLTKLQHQNIQANPNMTFREVAETAGVAPIDVFEMMK